MKELFKYISDKKVYGLITLIIILLGYYLIEKGISLPDKDAKTSNILISIGTSLIATSIVLILDIWKNFSLANIFKKVGTIINEGGIEEIYRKRDIDRYDELVQNLGTGIDICGYSLGGFFESFSDTLKTRLANQPLITARVIFVDPKCEAAKKRAEIEGKSVQMYEQKFETFKNHFAGSTNMQIRTIDCPLSSMIFRIDSVLFIGPHFYKKQSKATHTFELKENRWLFTEYQNEFDRMWTDAKTI